MKFAAILKSLLLVTAASLLAACGGGSSGGDSVYQPPAIRITATPTATSVQSGQHIDIAVRVTQANGANVADNTTVNSTVTPASNGVLQSVRNGELGSGSGSTVGGVANFRFTGAGAGGSTTLTFSVPNTTGSATSTTVSINVTPAPDLSWRITATAEATTLPANTATPVTVRLNRADGTPVPDGTIVRATTSPAGSGVITTAEGGDVVNESATVGGIARFYFQAGPSAGPSTATFSATNPDLGEEIVTTSVQFTITAGPRYIIEVQPVATTLAAHTSTDVTVRVRNANGSLVTDGTLVNAVAAPANAGTISAIGGGAPDVGTVAGIARFTFTAGASAGRSTVTFSVNNAETAQVEFTITDGPRYIIQVQPAATTLAAHTSTDVTVTVKHANGSLVSDGTPVNAVAAPANAGTITAVGGGAPTVATVAGIARFTFTAGGTAGSATATFSVTDPDDPTRASTAQAEFTITDGPRYIIQIQPAATTLAAHTSTDVAVSVRYANGNPVPDNTKVLGVTVPDSSGTLVSVDRYMDGTTPSQDDREGGTVGGVVRYVFTAGGTPGPSKLVFSVSDPDAPNQLSSAEVVLTITEGPSLLIEIQPAATNVRPQSRTDVTVRVRSASGALVADGTVVSAVVVPESRGLVLGAQNNQPTVPTVGGVASFAFLAGTQAGSAEAQFSVLNAATGEVVTASTTFTINSLPGRRVTVQLLPATIPLNGRSDIRVEVLEADGRPVADGTVVNAIVFPSSLGELDKTSTPTLAGLAVFQYQAESQIGNVDLVFSATVADAASQPVVGRARLQIAATDDTRLRMEATRTRLPVNHFAVPIFMGSPYMAEVTVTVKDSNGQPVNMEDGVQASINQVGLTGGFSRLDDPETECDEDDIPSEGCNEFLTRVGQAPVHVVAGKATIFVHSLNYASSTTLTVTTVDPVSGGTLAAAMDFEIVEATPPTPSQLLLVTPTRPIYVQGSGGNGSGLLHIELRDAIGQQVPDPEAGVTAYNNYRLEIVGANPEQTPRLSGINAAGTTVTGSQIDLRTTNGIGGANFIAGDGVGSFVVRLTADRADNNVDNGISDAVVLERSVVVSDGRLFDLEITQPIENALTINPQNGDIEVNDEGLAIPPSPDGTYSVTVAIIATDRLGNPVLPGTTIRFGMIDAPQASGVGDYYIAGGDGDPQEGGVLFTAADGRFLTAGGGVGAGDTLVVLAEDVVGNRDMESARVVTEVHTQTSLSVDYRFNHNDTTGQSVDYAGILPYVIGRAADGNIVATATTNDIGVAVTKLNYPASQLGKLALVWAQGDGPVVAGQPKKVTDVEYTYFAGVSNARLVVSPSVLPANTTQDVTICVYDALSVPVGGVPIQFAFRNLMGNGFVDDIPNSGSVDEVMSFGNGCATATVRTSSVVEGEGDAALVFSAAGQSANVTFSFQPLVLLANPSAMSHSGEVILTLLNGSGQPQSGFQIVGSCTSSGGAAISIASGPGVTNGLGRTNAIIDALNLNQIGGAGSGVCTFSTVDGSATATVTLQGQDVCNAGFSPPPPGCPTETVDEFTLNVTLHGGPNPGMYAVSSAPSGISCTAPVATSFPCGAADFDTGTLVILQATPGPAGGEFNRWEGDCQPMGTTLPLKLQARVTMGGNRTCQAFWGP